VEEDVYGLDIDGVGDLIPQLRDSSSVYARGKSPCPTGFGVIGRQLELIVSPGDRVFGQKPAIGADAYAESLESGEPLLRHPLNASDAVPGGNGVKLPARGRHMPRCVAFHAP
jgi:hypothetical protein